MKTLFSGERLFQVLLVIVSLIGGALIARLQRERKQLQYTVMADTRLLSGRTEDFRGDLELLHDGRPIGDPQLLIVRFENIGNRPVLPSDYLAPINFELTSGQVVSAGVTQKSNASIDVDITVQGQTISLKPLLMNPKDWVDLKIFTDGPAGDISASSRIAGVGTIRKLTLPREQRSRRLVRSSLALLISLTLLSFFSLIVAYQARREGALLRAELQRERLERPQSVRAELGKFISQESGSSNKSPGLLMAQGVMALDANQFDKASKYFTQVIKLRPKSSLGYLCRGMALSAEGKKDQALEDFRTVLRLVSPSTPVGKEAQQQVNLLRP